MDLCVFTCISCRKVVAASGILKKYREIISCRFGSLSPVFVNSIAPIMAPLKQLPQDVQQTNKLMAPERGKRYYMIDNRMLSSLAYLLL